METYVLIRRNDDGTTEILRTFTSDRRAKEDLALMEEHSTGEFKIVIVEHIDS